ncbi:MAG: hypothetical protein ACO1N9_10680 [Flavobacterium sp.]
MQYKIVLLLAIVMLIVLMLYIRDSRKRLWQGNRQAKVFTLRSLLLIGVVILFLVFSLLR